MEKKTKVVCTIGPSTDAPGILEKMLQAGMNVARFNFSHGSHEEHTVRIAAVRAASEKTGIPVALMLDTKGPEMRLGMFKDDQIMLEMGKPFTLTTRQIEGTVDICTVSHAGLPSDVRVGSEILLSDGLVTLVVDSIEGTEIHTTVKNSGKMSSRKRVAVPGMPITLPPVSDADESDLRFGCSQGMDYVAASFMQRGEDVVAVRRILEEEHSDIQIISKVENEEGIINIDDIVKMSDGLMVARGDLGVEIPAEEVPMLQKMLISKCNAAGKPVITATQMLESMTTNPRPTRAETSDVANAIMDGTDAIMLSGETASGKYPVEAVETMTRVAQVTEKSDLYHLMKFGMDLSGHVTTDAISEATVTLAKSLEAEAILTATETGKTALSVSKNHPDAAIIAVTPREETIRRCQLYWGVEAIKGEATTNSDDLVMGAIEHAMVAGKVSPGALVVVTAGVPSGKAGKTNMIRVHLAGNVILQAGGIGKGNVSGRVCVAKNAAQLASEFQNGDIIVVKSARADFVPFIERAKAIIAEEGGYSSSAAIIGINLGIPAIIGAEDATDKLVTGTHVTVDASGGSVVENRKQ